MGKVGAALVAEKTCAVTGAELAARLLHKSAHLTNPWLQEPCGCGEERGKLPVGTIAGGHRDLAMSILRVPRDRHSTAITDMGVGVPTAENIEAARAFQPDVVRESALLAATIPNTRTTVAAKDVAGLHSNAMLMRATAIRPRRASRNCRMNGGASR